MDYYIYCGILCGYYNRQVPHVLKQNAVYQWRVPTRWGLLGEPATPILLDPDRNERCIDFTMISILCSCLVTRFLP